MMQLLKHLARMEAFFPPRLTVSNMALQSLEEAWLAWPLLVPWGMLVDGINFYYVLAANTPLTKRLNVAIIDNNPALGRKPCIRKKTSLIPGSVQSLVQAYLSSKNGHITADIGAWKYVEQHRHAYFDKMQVWDYTGLGYTSYNARDVNKDSLGCVVENKVLLSSLLSCMQDTDSPKKIYATRLASMTILPKFSSMGTDSISSPSALLSQGRLAKLELSDGNSLYAELVVGADGGKS
ncbi:hypothetical protein SLE2022_153850 [Rubroshorea leprosula]